MLHTGVCSQQCSSAGACMTTGEMFRSFTYGGLEYDGWDAHSTTSCVCDRGAHSPFVFWFEFMLGTELMRTFAGWGRSHWPRLLVEDVSERRRPAHNKHEPPGNLDQRHSNW